MTKRLFSIGLLSIGLMVLIYTEPLWSRYPGGFWIPLIFLIIIIGFFWLVVKLAKEVVGLVKNRKTFMWSHLLPAVLIGGFFCFTIFNTFSFDIEDNLYGKVIFQACYEGTQSHTVFKLRENDRFEIHSTGALFYDVYFTGQYLQRGDTLELIYDKNVRSAVGEKLLMNNENRILTVLKENENTARRPLVFHYGYCKGLN